MILYRLLGPLLFLLIRSFTNSQSKLGAFFVARENWRAEWREKIEKLPRGPRVLVHVASVGELEQVRPVLEEWRAQRKFVAILSFSSPSITRVARDLSFVDAYGPLPLDLVQDTSDFFALVQPNIILLDRYELWPNFIARAEALRIPVALLNVSTPPQGFWGGLSLWFRRRLFQAISLWTFVDAGTARVWQHWQSARALGFVTGDPRVDRALSRARQASIGNQKLEAVLRQWNLDQQRLIVAGSTWEPDARLVIQALALLRKAPGFETSKLVLVPHEPNAAELERTEVFCREAGLTSFRLSQAQASGAVYENCPVMLVDAVGFLAELYALAGSAFVGGGFGRCIHSVIEPIAHGVPVAFGPKFQRVPEAHSLLALGGAKAIPAQDDSPLLALWWQATLRGGAQFSKAREGLELFISMHRNASQRSAEFLEEKLASFLEAAEKKR